MPAEPVVMAWSGGKDSAMALWTLVQDPSYHVTALLTTTADGAVTMQGFPRSLLHEQASSLGLPIVEVALPTPCSEQQYADAMTAALADPVLAAIEVYAFGDLFLEDLRASREAKMASVGKRCIFPIWTTDTPALARRFLDSGFEAVVTSVDTRMLSADFCGRNYDAVFLADLPDAVDPCGEYGEFHSFVHSGPLFDQAIPFTRGSIALDDDIARAELHLGQRAYGAFAARRPVTPIRNPSQG